MFALKLAKQSAIFVARLWYLFLFLGIVVYAVVVPSKPATPPALINVALNECMDKHRWDTTAVRTSRFAVEMHYHRQGKGELAKYVSDHDAVKMVYCSDK